MVISDAHVSVSKGFTALVSADCCWGGGRAAGLCQGDYVMVSFLGALMQNIAYLYIWFLYWIGLCCSRDDGSAQIPQRSLTINSEVADAARQDGVWASGWQGSHHSCVTRPDYIWHVPSNTGPSLLRHISATDIPSKDLHWFHSISLRSVLGIVTCEPTQLFSYNHPHIHSKRMFLDLYLSTSWCMCWCPLLLKLSGVLTFPDVSVLLPYVQWELGRLVLICHQSCSYAGPSTEKYSLCLVREWIDNG